MSSADTISAKASSPTMKLLEWRYFILAILNKSLNVPIKISIKIRPIIEKRITPDAVSPLNQPSNESTIKFTF